MDTSSLLHRLAAATFAAATSVLSACSHPVEPVAPAPKPVKTEIVSANGFTGAITGSFVGTLRAHQRSDLSFETGGRVAAILVEVGDRVRAGQELARLDPGPARWRLDKAAADHSAALAALNERSIQLQQQEALERDGIIAPAALESARAAHALALSQRGVAEAALAAARRDLALTRITAPYDGEVVARLAQPLVDAAPGQAILQVQAGQVLEVVAMLPEAVAATLAPGGAAHGKSGESSFGLVLERLSARSENGSLVQAIFRLAPQDKQAKALRSGAVVAVEVPRAGAGAPLSLPVTALMPGVAAGRGSVFVLDKKGLLQRRQVSTGSELLPQGRVAVRMGVQQGDEVVVAGTAFLHEGQAVVAHVAQTLLQGAAR